MDLNEVIEKVEHAAQEAGKAFRAGHNDVAEKYLMDQMLETGKYFDENLRPESDVTDSATSEKPAEVPEAKPAEVPGAPAKPAAEGPVLPASQFGGSLTDEKPSQ